MTNKFPYIGELKHRVILQHAVINTDEIGGTLQIWQDKRALWAKIETKPAQSIVWAHQFDQDVIHIFTMRWSSDIRLMDRFICNNRIYLIKALDDFNQDQLWLRCYCQEDDMSDELSS